MKTKKQRVRFWAYINHGMVKLTLSEGQSISYRRSWSHDEGYSFEGATYTLEDNVVYREWGNGGSDCDGPISQSGADMCPIQELAERPCYVSDEKRGDHLFRGQHIHLPEWKEFKPTRVRDVYAQRMNY
jgi:hypothetical protein